MSELDEFMKIDSIDAEAVETEMDSSTIETQEEVEEEDIPQFDKTKTQERFQTLTQHNRELKEKLEEMEARVAEIAESTSQRNEEEESSQIPEWFSNVMGENEEAWQGFQGMTAKMKQEAIEAIKNEGSQERQQEEQAAKEGMDWVTNQMELVEETYGQLSESKRNELMSVVEKYTPTDNEGNLDFVKGYELMQLLGTKKPDTARKALVDTDGSSHTIDTEGFQGKTVIY